MNFVRFGVMWEAVEKSPGVYDDEYLERIRVMINQMGERGLFVLVDMHQDVFARSICGEGIPDFYAKDLLLNDACITPFVDKLLDPIYKMLGVCWDFESLGFERDENGDPLIKDC